MTAEPLDHTFTGPIQEFPDLPGFVGVILPGSQELFGTGKSVKVSGTMDAIPIPGAFMPTGAGEHFVSVSKAARKKLGKDVGDEVTIHLTERLS